MKKQVAKQQEKSLKFEVFGLKIEGENVTLSPQGINFEKISVVGTANLPEEAKLLIKTLVEKVQAENQQA